MGIEYAKAMLVTVQMQAMRAHAEIVSGAYKLSNKARGREPNEEEKARGEVIGWTPLTEPELLKDKVDEMKRHVARMSEWADTICNLETKE